MYSLLVNSSSEKPQSVTKFNRSASNNVRPKVTNLAPTFRSRQFQPSPSCFAAGLSMGMFMRMGAFAQHVEAAAIGALDAPVLAQIEVDFGMPQRAATAVAGDAVGVDGDGFERLGHDLAPIGDALGAPADDS